MPPSKGTGRLAAVASLITVLLAPSILVAQIATSTLQGKVTDGTGVLPGATVTAREVQSGFTQEAVTDVEGSFTLPGLRPGTYEIRVAMEQFKPQTKTVEVLVGQTITANGKPYTAIYQLKGSARVGRGKSYPLDITGYYQFFAVREEVEFESPLKK